MRRGMTFLGFALVLTMVAVAGWAIGRAIDPRSTQVDSHVDAARTVGAPKEEPDPDTRAALTAGVAFLDRYVQPDGSVVRHDEGGDVVSEGQAYAMLVAVAIGDEQRFRAVWSWAKTHLLRSDGVMSWHWNAGSIVDFNSATDADLDAARALLIAGQRFGAVDLTVDGRQLSDAALAYDTVSVGPGTGRVVTAGDWVTESPYMINPSYFNPRAELELARASAEGQWAEVTRTQRAISSQLVGPDLLPPDWAFVNATGGATPTGVNGGPVSQFGLDAARFPVRMAESCDPADRSLAAAMRPTLDSAGAAPAVRQLNGAPAADWTHPIAHVAAAAADYAAGDGADGARELDAAAATEQQHPTYYGSAWVALGRIMLQTSLLGGCDQAPVGAPTEAPR